MPQVGFVLFENASRSTALAQAKFAAIANQYRNLSNHEGTSKPSLPDYEALIAGNYSPAPWSEGVFGGSPAGRDGPAGIAPGYWGSQANLFTQLAAAGKTWKTYEEGVNGPGGYTTWGNAGTGSLHVSRHCPASFFTATKAAGADHANGRYDFDELVTDISGHTLPNYFFLTPNNVNNGHDNGLAPANQFLLNGNGGLFPGIDTLIAAMSSDGILVITFDNLPTADTSQPITGTGVVYCVIAGPGVTASVDATYYNHFSLVRATQVYMGVTPWTTAVDSNYTSAPSLQFSAGTTNKPTAPPFTAPAAGQQFSGTSVTVTVGNSTGGTGHLTYQISRDGGAFANMSGGQTETDTYAAGPHTVSARVIDLLGNIGDVSTITFRTGVSAPPGTPLITVAYSNSNPRFVNANGDQVLLRGTNLTTTTPSSYVNLAIGMGLNTIRMVCNWNRFEATAPTGSGSNYAGYVHTLTASEVATLDSFCTQLAAAGIYLQIDLHQANWSPYFDHTGGFSGSGVPSWYYTDARFKPAQNGGSGWSTAQQGPAINAFWTDANEKPMAQTLYNAWAQAMVQHVLAQPYAPHVVGYQIFNEPNPGTMAGSTQQKISNIHAWLASTVTAVRAVDPARAIFVMCSGGGVGWGDAIFTDAFGTIAQMQAKNMVLEYHSYYTGKMPGKNASAAGDVGYKAPQNDDYFPDSNSCHNTPAGSNYVGTQQGLENFESVPIAKAASLQLPLFRGEFGVRYDDPGRLNYIQQITKVFDAHKLSCTQWKLGATPGDTLGLVTNSVLNDMGKAYQTWFKATQFVIPAGGGSSGPVNQVAPTLNASALTVGQTVGFTPGTWAGAATVTDRFQVSPTGDPAGTDWVDAP